MPQPHILLVTFPAQGHLNPSLQFAKRLLQMGVHVTLATSLSAHRRISTTVAALGLTFASFSDGYDDGFKMGIDDADHFMSEMRTRGSQTVGEVISSSAKDGRPIGCVVYTILLSWAPKVARELHVPSALLWIQAASVLDIFHYYFNGYDEIISTNGSDPNWSIELPGLPLLEARDLPSFILPSNPYSHALKSFKEQIETIDEEKNPKVLVNTFDALEPEALRAVAKLKMIGIGPLIPSAFLDGQDPSDNSFGGDLFEKSIGYMEFLDSKLKSSVIYISFGSLIVLQDVQLEEIARAVLESGRPFLWVIRAEDKNEENKAKEKPSFMEELEKQGMIVPWCSQLEVLSHPSLGCFMTHCGWNSMLESLSCGVPTVALPKWTDQATNAKLIEDVWGSGVRVRANEDGVVERGEISRCVEMVMGGGERGDELRRNALKWKVLAREALKEGGSSYKNLKEFAEEL